NVFSVGDTAECSFDYTVTQADMDAGRVVNEAQAQTVFGTAAPVNVRSAAATATVVLDTDPVLEVVKTAPAASGLTAGAGVGYQIAVRNAGNVTLGGITIADPLLPGLSCPVPPGFTLAVGAEILCSGTYTLTQA